MIVYQTQLLRVSKQTLEDQKNGSEKTSLISEILLLFFSVSLFVCGYWGWGKGGFVKQSSRCPPTSPCSCLSLLSAEITDEYQHW